MSEDSNRDPRVEIVKRAIKNHIKELNNCRKPVKKVRTTKVGCLGINPGKELYITDSTLYNIRNTDYVSIEATSFKKGEQLTGKDGKEI